jgi:Flp pilus assembly protein TadD
MTQPAADRERFARAAAEFIAAQRLNDDRPEARSALGSFLVRRNSLAEAEIEYKAALRLDPAYGTAAVNLADLYRMLGRDAMGETVLRKAIATAPNDAGVHYTLGLTLVRLKHGDEALAEFRRAAELSSDLPRFAYVYAIALHSAGRGKEAAGILKNALAQHPNDSALLSAAINFAREAGDIPTALQYAEQLARLLPDDRNLARLIAYLKQQRDATTK